MPDAVSVASVRYTVLHPVRIVYPLRRKTVAYFVKLVQRIRNIYFFSVPEHDHGLYLLLLGEMLVIRVGLPGTAPGKPAFFESLVADIVLFNDIWKL